MKTLPIGDFQLPIGSFINLQLAIGIGNTGKKCSLSTASY